MKRFFAFCALLGFTLAQGVLGGGQAHSAFVGQGGLWLWGWNYDGQLGDGTFRNALRPNKLLEGVLGVAVGNLHTLVLFPDGRVWAFGANEKGQLGDGSSATRAKPVEVFAKAKGVAAGYGHSLLLSEEGHVYAAGSNEEGQLGDGTRRGRNRFARVEGLERVKGVAAGYFHSLAWTEEGALFAWGANLSGQLGLGTVESQGRPVKVLEGVVAAVAGGSFSAALLRDGRVVVAGLDSAAFQPLEGLPRVRAMAAGRAHLLLVGEDGRVYALGENEEGQLGDGTQEGRLEARPVPGLEGVVAVGAGDAHSLVLLADGSLWAFGANTYGQLGDGTRERRLRPVRVRFP